MKDLAEDPQLACEGAFRGEDYALADDLFGEENRVGKGEGRASAVGVRCGVEGEDGGKLYRWPCSKAWGDHTASGAWEPPSYADERRSGGCEADYLGDPGVRAEEPALAWFEGGWSERVR